MVRRIDIAQAHSQHLQEVLRREWLITNGLGGYASGTISGTVSRRYHGLLVAALPAPLGRVVMLSHLAEFLLLPDGSRLQLSGQEPDVPHGDDRGNCYLKEFRLEKGLPFWRYEAAGCVIEKRVLLVHGQNTVNITYWLKSGDDKARLQLVPSMNFRQHEAGVSQPVSQNYALTIQGHHYAVSAGDAYPQLRLCFFGARAAFTYDEHLWELAYEREAERGYEFTGTLWNPGTFAFAWTEGQPVTLMASTEPWNRMLAMEPDAAFQADTDRKLRLISLAHLDPQDERTGELVLAADQFIIRPVGRVEDAERAAAAGDEVRAIIAGYHWFTDWGRDTMISLEGLTLCTGRHTEAGWILRIFGQYIQNGLVPNLFPEGQTRGLYHTADATLWYFHAIDRYLQATNDRITLVQLLPRLVEIAEHHLRGTDFGIGVDPSDGLLKQGAPGYQLTWMDAKVGDWVVTPRRGKAVEINALWYNALKLLEGWLQQEERSGDAERFSQHAEQCRRSFNQRFWSDERGYLLDVVDGEHGDDAALRPNQVLAVSLEHPILERAHWAPMLDRVRQELLTPAGLRTLCRSHPDYKSRYFGDLRARDAAYHQGTVWAWLIGPFIDAWLKAHPEDKRSPAEWLDGLFRHLDDTCIGTLSEVFDAEEPFTARGCIAQAWSIAELLRCKAKLGARGV